MAISALHPASAQAAGATAPPAPIVPMRATAGPLPPNDAAYGIEFKWDGIRTIAHVRRGRVFLQTRNLLDVTPQYPELQTLEAREADASMVLDGEIVALDATGRPDFELLQQRMNLASPADIRQRMPENPVSYFAFDLLYLDGRSLLREPYEERRRKLEALAVDGETWATPPYHTGHAKAVFETSREQGLEGVVAKRLDSRYEPGVRSPLWIKTKHRLRQEFVVGGWTQGEGGRAEEIGALLVGYYERGRPHERPRFVYAGKVGTGFTSATLRQIKRVLRPLAVDQNPFDVGDPERGARFVEARLIVELEFAEWTHNGTLRQASFKGIRIDKDPLEVVREPSGMERS